MYETEDADILQSDIGRFIPQGEIVKWWTQQQRKFPTIYSKDEPCPMQHAMNTKLMSYKDDDPSKPIRVIIVGSRWRKDKFMGKQPMYILQNSQTQEWFLTEVTAAHEAEDIGWKLGWDVPPPSPYEWEDHE
jgi:hypothetical protein